MTAGDAVVAKLLRVAMETDTEHHLVVARMVEVVNRAIAEEREACARVVEEPERQMDHNAGQWGGYGLGQRACVFTKETAAAIRART